MYTKILNSGYVHFYYFSRYYSSYNVANISFRMLVKCPLEVKYDIILPGIGMKIGVRDMNEDMNSQFALLQFFYYS